MEIFLQVLVVLAALVLGAKAKGIGLGIWGGLGLLVLTLFFGVKPTSAPIDVMLILISVVTASSLMYAAGGIDCLVKIAEKIIRSNPKRITFIAPLTTWFFAALAGTAHIQYPLFPVIYEVAHAEGIRPERPMTVSMIAGCHAITASPVSAATAAMLGLFASHNLDVGLGQILLITVPASLIGIFCASLVMCRYGKELKDDPEYQKRLKEGLIKPSNIDKSKPLTSKAIISAVIFVLGVVYVVAAGFFPALRTPAGASKAIGMATFLQIFMLSVSALIYVICRPKLATAVSSPIMQAGVTAMIAVFGLAWLGDSFITAHKAAIMESGKVFIGQYPWVFALFLFFISAVLSSQAATVRAMMPLGLALGLAAGPLVGMLPAINGTWFFPTNGPLVANMAFDQSGTCRIGKYVLNHSYMLPGLVATICAVCSGLIIQNLVI